MWYTVECYPAMRKEDILLFSIWMDHEHSKLSERSQREKDKYCMNTTYTWNPKKIKCIKISVKLLASEDGEDEEGVRLIVFKCTN